MLIVKYKDEKENWTMNNNLQIILAIPDDLEHILTTIDNAAKWMQENGIANQWMPGNVFKDKAYYID